jgi:hypothetical protein
MRLNALPIKLPGRCLSLSLKRPIDWEAVKTIENEARGGLILTKDDDIWAWGSRSVVARAFGANLISAQAYDLPKRFFDRLHMKAFLEKALSHALVRGKPLVRRTRSGKTYLIVDRKPGTTSALLPISNAANGLHGDIPGLYTTITDEFPEQAQVSWSEAAQISIEEKNGAFWLVIDPDIWIWPKRARRNAVDLLDARRSNRYNAKADALLSAWCHVLLGTNDHNTSVDVTPFNSGDESENPEFTIGTRTAFSQGARP